METREDLVACLTKDGFDLILADFSLPSFDGLSALRIAAEKSPDLPFIFVSGALGEELAIDALKIGATDYVLKKKCRAWRAPFAGRCANRKSGPSASRRNSSCGAAKRSWPRGRRISHTGSWGWILSTGKVIWSEEQYRMLGFEPGKANRPSIRS